MKFFWIILIAFICACTSKQHPDGSSHPDPEQLPKAEEISYVLNMKNADQKLSSPRYDFGNYELSHSIGSADGADEYYLYNLKHMRMDDDGNVYITKGDNIRRQQIRFRRHYQNAICQPANVF